MPKKYTENSLIEFQELFPDEEASTKYFIQQRWPRGFVCPQCRHDEAWYLSKRKLFDCKNCRVQTSITAGTIFQGTRRPLVKWYWLLYHLAMDKEGVSTDLGDATNSGDQAVQDCMVDGSQSSQGDVG